jgi:hypothetical protein
MLLPFPGSLILAYEELIAYSILYFSGISVTRHWVWLGTWMLM